MRVYQIPSDPLLILPPLVKGGASHGFLHPARLRCPCSESSLPLSYLRSPSSTLDSGFPCLASLQCPGASLWHLHRLCGALGLREGVWSLGVPVREVLHPAFK